MSDGTGINAGTLLKIGGWFLKLPRRISQWDKQRVLRAASTLKDRSSAVLKADHMTRNLIRLKGVCAMYRTGLTELQKSPTNYGGRIAFVEAFERTRNELILVDLLRSSCTAFDPRLADACLVALNAFETANRGVGVAVAEATALGMRWQAQGLDQIIARLDDATVSIAAAEEMLASYRRRQM